MDTSLHRGWFAGSGVCFAVQFGADLALVFHTLAVKARCQRDGYVRYEVPPSRLLLPEQGEAACSNYLPCRNAPGCDPLLFLKSCILSACVDSF